METITTQCCIAGGGTAGMMLGLLLARAGVNVLVLEKHEDFLRDFRGDTVHPSTMEVLHELGILDEFLRRPHQKVREIKAVFEDVSATVADFSHLPTVARYVAYMPQWEFLDFIATVSRRFPGFELKMQSEVVGLLSENGLVCGVQARTPQGIVEVRADLVVGADGRQSALRTQADLRVIDLGASIDVLWFRIARQSVDGDEVFGRIANGRTMVMLNRGDYWQCAYVIRKGDFEAIQLKGIESFRRDIVAVAPFLAGRMADLNSWDAVKLLTVKVDRLQRWYRRGFLCIGDASHAMSPIGGVGINIAIQDAVAAANILSGPLLHHRLTLADLQRVQRRRELPARLTQWVQVQLQNRLVRRLLESGRHTSLPFVLTLLQRWPYLRRFPAYLVGIGFRPEHVWKSKPR